MQSQDPNEPVPSIDKDGAMGDVISPGSTNDCEDGSSAKSREIEAHLEGRSSSLTSGEDFGLAPTIHQSWAALMMAHHKARQRVARRVEAAGGMALDWYDTLLVLEYAPDNRMRMGELGEYITLSQSGFSRLVDRIEAAGYIKRQLSSEDRRVFEAVLTPEGRAAREASWPLYAHAIAEGFGNRYTAEQAKQLAELLNLQLSADCQKKD